MNHSQLSETKPDPNLQAEEPSPPGGPLRQDGKAEEHPTGGHDDDASASRTNDKHASESGGGTIPIEDEQPSTDRDREEDLQEENAETSLVQPSGSGSGD